MDKDTTHLLDRLTEELTTVLRRALSTGLATVEQEDVRLRDLEQVTRHMMQRLGRCYLEALVAACQPEERPREIPCRCGGRAQYVRMREGTVITWMGQVRLERAYYLCPTCHAGTFPLDEQLQLRAGGLSASLQEGAALVGIQVPFGEGSELFERLTLVTVSDNGIREATEQLGQERAAAEAEQVEAAWDPQRFELPEGPAETPQRLYGSLDGTSVRTDEGWREPKLGCWYTTTDPPPEARLEEWQPQAEQVHYYADLAPAEEFGRLFYVSGLQQGAHQAAELIFVADGAPWIWNLVQLHFPGATEIVDWYHAAEYVWRVAHKLYGEDSAPGAAWAEQCLAYLWEGEFEALLTTFCAPQATDAGTETLRKALEYFTTHRHRMRYPEFRAQGYHIGSGTIESGCKRVIGARLKQAGMTWSEAGSRQVMKARAMYLSGEWDAFCEQRPPLRRTYARAA